MARIEGEFKGSPKIGDVMSPPKSKKRKGKGSLYHSRVAGESQLRGLVAPGIEGIVPGSGTKMDIFDDRKPSGGMPPRRRRRTTQPDRKELLSGLEEAIQATFAQEAFSAIVGRDVGLVAGFTPGPTDLPEIL